MTQTNQQGAPEALRPEMLDDLIETFATAGLGRHNLMRVELPRHQWAQLAVALSRLHTENVRLSALVEAQQPAKAESLRQILTDPENQPNQYGVQFLMHGPKMAFKIGARQFTLDYEPTEPGEFEFMRDALISAFSIFTPDVKMAQQPAPSATKRICNTCQGTGIVKGLHNWGSGGTREEKCWNCHEAPQPAPSAAAAEAVVVYEQKENEMQVWFRPARMHGHPERTPIKATITKDRGNGIVDLTYDDGEFSGSARAVPNALRLPRNVREQVAVWWDVGFEMDFQTAVDNSLKKKKDDPPPQPSPTPQADSQPAPVLGEPTWTVFNSGAKVAEVESLAEAMEYLTPERLSWQWYAVCVVDQSNMPKARAPADSVTAPAGD